MTNQPRAHRNSTEPRNSSISSPPSSSELVLIRGLPGSGKSTMAATLAAIGFAHFEADMFFLEDGVYRYDPSRIRDAHRWCQTQAHRALLAGQRTVVANTFTKLQELEPYFTFSSNVRVIEAKGRWENVHGVPEEKLREMARRWEDLPRSGLGYSAE